MPADNTNPISLTDDVQAPNIGAGTQNNAGGAAPAANGAQAGATGVPNNSGVSGNLGMPDNSGAPAVLGGAPAEDVDLEEVMKQSKANALALLPEIVEKVSDARNILVALSSDPSVDELSAAIGLSIYFDRLGKRATAIYSGKTPNALKFLKPDETFDTTADTLQDFVIALNKDKADHLRYKLDGDYVKVFITPYRSRIAEEDLEFSYGDFNIDLVLALNVANGVDLDAALREHGRIMHDATVINVTIGNPGKFGEIEWSDKSSSSVSEMAARLVFAVNRDKVEAEEATALLTGIVAATNRFSKGNTYADTMRVASDLLEAGADHQLIAEHITPEVNNRVVNFDALEEDEVEPGVTPADPTALDVAHREGEEDTDETITNVVQEDAKENDALLDELQATVTELAGSANETANSAEISTDTIAAEQTIAPGSVAPVAENVAPAENVAQVAAPAGNATQVVGTGENVASITSDTANSGAGSFMTADPTAVVPTSFGEEGVKPERVIAPSANFAAETTESSENKYSDMLEAALAEPAPMPTTSVMNSTEAASAMTSVPIANAQDPYSMTVDYNGALSNSNAYVNPAVAAVPNVPSAPEVNNIPDMNFMPPADGNFAPPTPEINFDTPQNAAPAANPAVPGASAAFQIPGTQAA